LQNETDFLWGVLMGDRTVPERINEFLLRRPGRPYCDRCIQERLGLRWRQQVQLVTATLAVTGAFKRENAVCSTCMDRKQVTLYGSNILTLRAADAAGLDISQRARALRLALEDESSARVSKAD
jgi:hypothetical protein